MWTDRRTDDGRQVIRITNPGPSGELKTVENQMRLIIISSLIIWIYTVYFFFFIYFFLQPTDCSDKRRDRRTNGLFVFVFGFCCSISLSPSGDNKHMFLTDKNIKL